MLIVCPTCATTYDLPPAALGAGRSVRCAQCKITWFATPQSAMADAEPALAPAAVAEASAPPPAPKQQAGDDFTDDMANNVSVEAMPPSDEAAMNAGELAETEAPPLAPHDQAEPEGSKFDPGVPDDVETIAAKRARQTAAERKERRSLLRRLFSLPMLIMVLLAVVLGALQWRVALVRHFPQTASLFSMLGMPVNLRGLFFQDVKSRGEFHDGVMVLVVEGVIANLTRDTLEVPRLRFALRSASGHEVYAWTALPTKTLLGSGLGLPFRTRLASPPPDGRDVIVRFFNRRDASLGAP